MPRLPSSPSQPVESTRGQGLARHGWAVLRRRPSEVHPQPRRETAGTPPIFDGDFGLAAMFGAARVPGLRARI